MFLSRRGGGGGDGGVERQAPQWHAPCVCAAATAVSGVGGSLAAVLAACSTGRWACSQRCETSMSEGQGLRILHGHRQLRMVSRFRTLPGPIHQPNWLLEIERQGIYTVVRTLIFLGH